jgi:hypothetical protein
MNEEEANRAQSPYCLISSPNKAATAHLSSRKTVDQKAQIISEQLKELQLKISQIEKDEDILEPTMNSISKRLWTPEEDMLLLNQVSICKGNKNWRKIASCIPDKNAQQCSYRYHRLLNSTNKRKWTRSEDIQLVELVEKYGGDWQTISSIINNRDSEEIKERFEKKLDPNLKRCKFQRVEDEMIIKLHEELGNQWNEIAKHFKDRNASMIKNRYYSFLKKKTNELQNSWNLMSLNNNSNCCLGDNIKTNSDSSSIFSSSQTIKVNDKIGQRDNLGIFNQLSNYTPINLFDRSEETIAHLNMNNDIVLSEQILENQGSFAYTNDFHDDLTHINSFYQHENINSRNSDYIYTPLENQQMIIDDQEVNSLPKEILMKIDTDSPKSNIKQDNFNEEYNKSFSVNLSNGNQESPDSNVDISNSHTLLKQYHHLETVFKRVCEITNNKMNVVQERITANSLLSENDMRFLMMQQRLNEKTDLLELKLRHLKHNYMTFLESTVMVEQTPEITKNILLQQNEALIELINTTKLKITLIQQIENEYGTI